MREYAAQLIDQASKYAIPRFCIDASSAESLLESISNIRNSGYPQDQVKQMLGYTRVLGKELLADPAVSAELAGIDDAQEPLSIELTKESYSLIFGALDEFKFLAERSLAKEDAETAAKDTRIAELENQVSEMQAILDENPTETPAELDQPEEQVEEPTEQPANEDINAQLEAVTAKAAQEEQRAIAAEQKLESARAQIAELAKLQRKSDIEQVAELATALGKLYTRNKSKEEVIAYLESRTPESISNMLSDFTEELASREETPEQPIATEMAEPPKVADPTLQEQDQTNSSGNGATKSETSDIDALADKLHGGIIREADSTYMLETPQQMAQRLMASEQSHEGAA